MKPDAGATQINTVHWVVTYRGNVNPGGDPAFSSGLPSFRSVTTHVLLLNIEHVL
ncbi:hypothetical protein SCLCIDRAFT_1224003 [Scleroderma citrinum Foug A]|uniref:Uncharacterized protein n=1 Tax=Scleroderma citrinum Foug A TaxID=1036808 RepID=A0A0C3D7T7_9AGAM|nr:hypothetical protein SCLCIDRAFT_1224003 [Scleroderma citrinum Foug A]